jgi:hypothetical protein
MYFFISFFLEKFKLIKKNLIVKKFLIIDNLKIYQELIFHFLFNSFFLNENGGMLNKIINIIFGNKNSTFIDD